MSSTPTSSVSSHPSSSQTDTRMITVGEALDDIGLGCFQLILILTLGCYSCAASLNISLTSVLTSSAWEMTKVEEAILGAVTHIGIMLASVSWGQLSDKYGRQPIIFTSSALLLTFGIGTALSNNIYAMFAIRLCTGLALGAFPQIYTLFTESVPTYQRGPLTLSLFYFWAAGTLFLALVTWVSTTYLGWRYAVASACVLSLVATGLTRSLPESPMFLAQQSDEEEVIEHLERMTYFNRSHVSTKYIILEEYPKVTRGRLRDLFSQGQTLLTLLLCLVWFCSHACYQGMVLITNELVHESDSHHAGNDWLNGTLQGELKEPIPDTHSSSGHKDYLELAWTAMAELAGLLLASLLLSYLGHKRTMCLASVTYSAAIFVLVAPVESLQITWLLISLLMVRGSALATTQLLFVYTTEVYPTRLRGVALGLCYVCGTLGIVTTPAVAQMVVKLSRQTALALCACSGILISIFCLLLPVDPWNQDLSKSNQIQSASSGSDSKVMNEISQLLPQQQNIHQQQQQQQ